MKRTAFAIAAAFLLVVCVLVLTGLVPEWGRWYSNSSAYRLQVEAFLSGRLSLSESPRSLDVDLAWSEGGVHQVWGLGVPLWRAPFAAVARLLGYDDVPDILAFGAAMLLVSALVLRVFLHGAWGTVPGGVQSFPAWLIPAGTVAILLLFPPFIGLLRSRFEVYEEAVAYEYLFGLVLLTGVAAQASAPTGKRFYWLCGLAGMGAFVRPPLFLYGAATVIVAGLALHLGQRPHPGVSQRVADRLRLKPLLVGGVLLALGAGVLLATNLARFGSALEFGHSLNVSPFSGMVYATRFDAPYQHEPVLSAARELFGLLFQADRFNGIEFYLPGIFPGQSGTIRWRELYLKSFDLSYLALLLGGTAAGIIALSRSRRRWDQGGGRGDPGGRVQGFLTLWAWLSALPVLGFYLRSPLISSRYLLDLMPAFAALVLVAWLAWSRLCLKSDPAKHFLPLSLVVLTGWLFWQISQTGCYYGGPKILSRAEVQRQSRSTDGSAAISLPSAYDVSDDLSPCGIRYNGAGWYEGTGYVMPAVTLFVQDPGFLELEVAREEAGVPGIDVQQVRARIGLEFLERGSIAKTAHGWSIHFRGPTSPRYQRGIQPAFIAFVPNTELAVPVTPWRLLNARWRGERRPGGPEAPRQANPFPHSRDSD